MTRPRRQSDVILAHRVALKLHIVFCASYTQCWRKLVQRSIRVIADLDWAGGDCE